MAALKEYRNIATDKPCYYNDKIAKIFLDRGVIEKVPDPTFKTVKIELPNPKTGKPVNVEITDSTENEPVKPKKINKPKKDDD